MKKALIVFGGWDGHQPDLVAKRFEKLLKNEGFEVTVSDTLDAFNSLEELLKLELIVPVWTMAEITAEQCKNVSEAVNSGVGMAGCHGGMSDAFRNDVNWQFITGGQWVAHPGNDGIEFMTNIKCNSSVITEGIRDFKVKSEQYYLHVDPAVEVLATTRFPIADGPHTTNGCVDVPNMWTKRWGAGRVFYSALGHHDDIFDIEEAQTTMLRGMLWAAAGKAYAKKDSEKNQ